MGAARVGQSGVLSVRAAALLCATRVCRRPAGTSRCQPCCLTAAAAAAAVGTVGTPPPPLLPPSPTRPAAPDHPCRLEHERGPGDSTSGFYVSRQGAAAGAGAAFTPSPVPRWLLTPLRGLPRCAACRRPLYGRTMHLLALQKPGGGGASTICRPNTGGCPPKGNRPVSPCRCVCVLD